MIKDVKTGQIIKAGVGKIGVPQIRIEDRNILIMADLKYAFGIDCNVSEACVYAGIVPATLRRMFEDNPEFAAECAKLKNQTVLDARATTATAVKEDPRAAMAFLFKKRGSEFADSVIDAHRKIEPVREITRKVLPHANASE